jgi:hypothetical protein
VTCATVGLIRRIESTAIVDDTQPEGSICGGNGEHDARGARVLQGVGE